MTVVDHSLTSSEDTSFTRFWLSSPWILFQWAQCHQIHSLRGFLAQPWLQNIIQHIACNYTLSPKRSPNPPYLHSVALTVKRADISNCYVCYVCCVQTIGQPPERICQRRQRNRDAARKSRKKQTERADVLHEVSVLLHPPSLMAEHPAV